MMKNKVERKAEIVSKKELRADYLPAMEVSFEFPGVDPLDVYEGFARHGGYCKRLKVGEDVYDEMVHLDDLGMFRRFKTAELLDAFGIKDDHPLFGFFIKRKFGNKKPREILLADFFDYVESTRKTIFEMGFEYGPQMSLPLLAVKGIAIPEHLAQKDFVSIESIQSFYEALLGDIKESSLSVRKKMGSSLVNRRCKGIAELDLALDSEGDFVDMEKARAFVRPYLPESALEHYIETGQIRAIQNGNEGRCKVLDIRDVILEQIGHSFERLTASSIKRELGNILSPKRLDEWIKTGRVMYPDLISEEGLRYSDFDRVEYVIERLGQLGIEVVEPDTEFIFGKIGEVFEDTTDKKYDDVRFYFDLIRNCSGLDRETARALGRLMRINGQRFINNIIRNPHAAFKIACDLERIVETPKDKTLQTIFKGNMEKRQSKAFLFNTFVRSIESRDVQAERYERDLAKGECDREELITKYRELQDDTERLFKQMAVDPILLIRVAMRYANTPLPVPEINTDEDTLTSFSTYMGARHALAESVTKLAASVAKRYAGRSSRGAFEHRFLDRISDGNLGIMFAVDKWDPERGLKLCTYAHWWIRQSILRYGQRYRDGTGIKVTPTALTNIRKYNKCVKEFLQNYGRRPSATEISEITGMDISKVSETRRLMKFGVSLDSPVGDEDSSFGDIVSEMGYDDSAGFRQALESADRIDLMGCVKRLLSADPRDWEVVKLRYIERLSFEQVAERLGLTRQRVEQLDAKIIQKLRHPKRMRQIERNVPLELAEDFKTEPKTGT